MTKPSAKEIAFNVLKDIGKEIMFDDFNDHMKAKKIYIDRDLMVRMLDNDSRFIILMVDGELMIKLHEFDIAKPAGLPPAMTGEGVHEFDLSAGASDYVLAKVTGWQHVMLARYFHSLKEWHATNVHGAVEVSEWWPIPEAGTGTRVEA